MRPENPSDFSVHVQADKFCLHKFILYECSSLFTQYIREHPETSEILLTDLLPTHPMTHWSRDHLHFIFTHMYLSIVPTKALPVCKPTSPTSIDESLIVLDIANAFQLDSIGSMLVDTFPFAPKAKQEATSTRVKAWSVVRPSRVHTCTDAFLGLWMAHTFSCISRMTQVRADCYEVLRYATEDEIQVGIDQSPYAVLLPSRTYLDLVLLKSLHRNL